MTSLANTLGETPFSLIPLTFIQSWEKNLNKIEINEEQENQNKSLTILEIAEHKFYVGAALATLAIVAIIEGVAKLAMAILTSPALLFKEELPFHFLLGARDCFVIGASLLTASQVYNVLYPDSVKKTNKLVDQIVFYGEKKDDDKDSLMNSANSIAMTPHVLIPCGHIQSLKDRIEKSEVETIETEKKFFQYSVSNVYLHRFCFGAALAGLAIIAAIEGIAKLAMAILTSPTLLIKETLSIEFTKGARDCFVISGSLFTVCQYYNATSQSSMIETDDLFKKILFFDPGFKENEIFDEMPSVDIVNEDELFNDF